jgi:hypothetical protein
MLEINWCLISFYFQFIFLLSAIYVPLEGISSYSLELYSESESTAAVVHCTSTTKNEENSELGGPASLRRAVGESCK